MNTLQLQDILRGKTMMDHATTCAHYGDSMMPCTCGAEPYIVGVFRLPVSHEHRYDWNVRRRATQWN